MKNKFIKTIKIFVLTSLVLFTLTGCSLPDTLKDNLKVAFNSRAEANKSIASELFDAGLIRQDTYNKLVEDIDKKLGQLADNIGDSDADMQNLLKACVGFRLAPEPDHQDHDDDCPPGCDSCWVHGNGTQCGGVLSPLKIKNVCRDTNISHKPQCEDHYNGFITNYLVANESKLSNVLKNNVPCIKGKDSPIKPIEVISESLVKEINEQLSIPIYVLNTNVTDSNGKGLDEIVEAVRNASNKKDSNSNEAEQILAKYFTAATYKDKNDNKEKPLTVMDPAIPEQQIIRITTQNYDNNDKSDPTKFNGFAISNSYQWYTGTANFPSDEYGNVPGIDMTVSMGGEKVLAVRIIEFNQKSIQDLRDRTGISQSRYLVLNGRAYLMEYPLGYIEGFKESEDRKSYESIIKQSQLGFNLLTCNFSKFKTDENGKITNDSEVINDIDPYITFNGALNAEDISKASLVLYGETGVTETGVEVDPCNEPWDLDFGDRENTSYIVSTGRIVLRDYLEATYAPGVIPGEPLVVLGRKLRIVNLKGDKKSDLAQFFDKSGEVIINTANNQPTVLHINDFADLEPILSSSPKVKYISASTESTGDVSSGSTDPADSTDQGDSDTSEDQGSLGEDIKDMETEDIIKSSISKIDKLPTEIVTEIHCTTMFPGESIGKTDYSNGEWINNDKPMFYAMMVKKSMFESGLFSGWVKSTDTTQNSTLWWNDWLGNHGFQYKINSDSLVQFLKGNYAYNLDQEGIIVLDLETISKIQDEYTKDNQVKTARGLRTIFIVFGYALVAYAIILLIAWNVDVNVDLGFNILEKLSFGRWVAVKDYDEMPFMNTDEINFIKFTDLLLSCVVIITVGIILILVNIVDVVLMMIQLFGGIARYITRIIVGR